MSLAVSQPAKAQDMSKPDSSSVILADSAAQDSLVTTMVDDEALAVATGEEEEAGGFHKQLKTKFIDGNVGFMSLVALALVLEGAKKLCRNTRGPVSSVCYHALSHIHQPMDVIERSVTNYGGLQAANLEKGCSWIKLFIAMAPSLGFLGTVIGMVMAFDSIQTKGDISPTIVAQGMKVALITTIFGIIVALVLQLFYSYILSKIEHLTAQMEESAIRLLDLMALWKQNHSQF